HRYHAGDLLAGIHRRPVGHPGLPADIDDAGARVDQPAGEFDEFLDGAATAPVGERVGGGVHYPHEQRSAPELERLPHNPKPAARSAHTTSPSASASVRKRAASWRTRTPSHPASQPIAPA